MLFAVFFFVVVIFTRGIALKRFRRLFAKVVKHLGFENSVTPSTSFSILLIIKLKLINKPALISYVKGHKNKLLQFL